MNSPMTVSLALQPPSLHSLPSHSKARIASTRSGQRSFATSTIPSYSSTTVPSGTLDKSFITLSQPLSSTLSTASVSMTDSTVSSSLAPSSSRLARCSSLNSDLSSLAGHSHPRPHSLSISSSYQYPQSDLVAQQQQQQQSDASRVLWKAYSRVRMTIAETQAPNPLETVSEYWHSLSAPRQYNLQKHQQQGKLSSSHMDLSIDTSFCASLPSTSAPSTASPSGTSHRSSFSTELSNDRNSSDNSINLGSAASEMIPAHRSLSRTTSASTSNLSTMATTTKATTLASSIQCLHSSASEQGKLLARRSRTSLNRFLDSVLDNATSLAESNDAHESYSEGDDDDHGKGAKTKDQLRDRKLKMKMSSPPKPPRLIMPSPHTQKLPAVRKPMFFVSESDSEEEEEEEEEEDRVESEYEDEEEDGPLMMIKKKTIQPATVFQQSEEHEADGDCEASESEKEDVVDNGMAPMVRSSHLLRKSNNTHAPIHGRRQSLLSNLLQAEKLQSSSASTVAETMSLYPARPSQHHHHHQEETQQQRDLKHSGTSSQLLGSQSLNEDGSLKALQLVRTKKVYKNLDELAKASTSITTTTPHSLTAAVIASNIPTCELTSTTTPVASTVFSTWSRSRSLVVQSTSSAQRALLSASATLTDVLFRSSGK